MQSALSQLEKPLEEDYIQEKLHEMIGDLDAKWKETEDNYKADLEEL